MGRSGTDVAREASTMVLTDDGVATLVTAVESGRRVYGNVRELILTATFAGIVRCRVGTAVAARTDRAWLRRVGFRTNPLLPAGIAFEPAFTALLVWVPPFRSVFGTAPLPADVIGLIAVFPLLVWGSDELRRLAIRRRAGARQTTPTTTREKP